MERSVRLLLTLLVLLGGFAAVPAQARPCPSGGIEQVQPPGTGGVQSVVATDAGKRPTAQPSRERQAIAQPLTRQCQGSLPVREGDRALE